MTLILAIRLRGECGVKREIEDTMQIIGLKRRHAAVLIETNDSVMGMIRKINSFITWGEPSPETLMLLEKSGKMKNNHIGLKPPVKGLKSIKLDWPKGDLGYRGDEINKLVKRMM